MTPIPFQQYTAAQLRNLSGGIKVSPVLPFESPAKELLAFNDNRGHISLSGAQSKYSVVIRDGQFQLTKQGEQGTHILKPALTDFDNCADSPANEHLTMQIAEKVFRIETAANALCFFRNGEAAYVTRRYDVAADSTKIQQEDFASLAGITPERYGRDFKYSALSYEDIGLLIRRYIPAWKIEIVKFFDLILFNFLFSNGDAHIKNFSVIKNQDGDYRLAPAYDLINTQIHLPGDSVFALQKGLFADGRSFPMGISGQTFVDFGLVLGIPEKTVQRELSRFTADYPAIQTMVENSFMSEPSKHLYYSTYHTRLISFLRA